MTSYVDQGFVQVIPVRRRSSIEFIVQSSLKGNCRHDVNSSNSTFSVFENIGLMRFRF